MSACKNAYANDMYNPIMQPSTGEMEVLFQQYTANIMGELIPQVPQRLNKRLNPYIKERYCPYVNNVWVRMNRGIETLRQH